MDADNTKGVIKRFLLRSFRSDDVGPEEDIFALGFVNSLFALQLVEFLEGQFGIEVGNEDLELTNFQTINAITRFVERKRTYSGVA